VQSEVSVRKIVDFLQKLRHENIALIKLRVDRKPAFSLARGGGDVFIADEIDATGDADAVVLEPPAPQRA